MGNTGAANGKIRWGVLGVAKIAAVKVIPGMQRGAHSAVTAIASRDASKAAKAAGELGILKHYGSYEELLADPDIDAVYNPLPNHLHVPWTVKAAEAGKHVLCEKPVALSAAEARTLIAARDLNRVKIGEAFMVHLHPQWLRALEILRSGEIGDLRAFNFVFSYNNRDAENIRNKPELGGGAVMDIGCYPIHTSRWMFGSEPLRVSALMDRDPVFGTDRLTSALLEYPQGHAVFTCSTQMHPYQRAILFGTQGRIELEIPVNTPPDQESKILIHTSETRVLTIPPCDQYTLQGDAFSQAILNSAEVPVPLGDAIRNMSVIDAIFAAAKTSSWQPVSA